MPVLIITLFAHLVFTLTDAYWLFSWLDMPVHFLVGAGLAIVFSKNLGWSPSISMIAVVLLSFGWEYVERVLGFAQAIAESYEDAATDIAFGVIGGIVGSVYRKKE